MNKKERKALVEGLQHASPDTLDQLQNGLRKLESDLSDANTSFPETQIFLRKLGLTHVRELDRQGVEGLRLHLEKRLQEVTKKQV